MLETKKNLVFEMNLLSHNFAAFIMNESSAVSKQMTCETLGKNVVQN